MADLSLTGSPQLVDTFLRPVARIVAGCVGGLLSVLAGWFGGAWVAPLPLATCLLATEAWLAGRGDRPQTLRLQDGVLELLDPLAGDVRVDLAEITVATAYVRSEEAGRIEVAVVLGDDEDVRFAVRVLQRVVPESGPHLVPAETLDVLFGGIAGLFRALAPPERRPRQTFYDPGGTFFAALRETVPAAAWRRTGIRLWPGMEPEIDLFGYYRAVHSDWLVLDGHDWRRDGETGTIAGWTLATSEREAVLFQGLDRQAVQRLPLALVVLGSTTTVAVPAPLAAEAGPSQPLSSDLLHTHAPEGAALFWHLLSHTPRDRWPAGVERMIEERRGIRPDLEAVLPR